MLNMAVAAEPNRGITYAKVVTSILASQPLALVLLVGIFCSPNPPATIQIPSILGSNPVPMNIFQGNFLLYFLLFLFSLRIDLVVDK